MNVPLNEFNDTQRLWFGFLIASATKADGAVDPAEVEFLIKTLHFLKPEQKKKIQDYLKHEKILTNLKTIPEGLTRRHLTLIYLELIWVIVADGKLIASEKKFLKMIADWFGFSLDYVNKLLKWGELMLKAEKYKREIVAEVNHDQV